MCCSVCTKADEGELKINGKEIKKHSARNAFQCGLGMVHQHFMLVDALTVWENVVIGNEPGKFSINKKGSNKKRFRSYQTNIISI